MSPHFSNDKYSLVSKGRIYALIQGTYYLITGIWPLLHLESFLWVTGHKTDLWLLFTVAWLITTIGFTLLAAYILREVCLSTAILGLTSAITLGGVDVYFSASETIDEVYLYDAIVEFTIAIAWMTLIARYVRRPEQET